MKQVLTLVCKLQPTPEQVVKIEATLKAFADACNYANEQVKPQITSKTTIQNIVYEDLRSKFGLAANLAVRACARVGANRKTAKVKGKPIKSFRPTSADYDARIFSFWEEDWAVSLTTVDGRERIKLNAGNYQRGKLKGQKPTSAQLCKHRDHQYYIHIQIKDEAPTPIKSTRVATTEGTSATHSLNNVIGIDFGRTDIAVTSNGDKWDGKQLTKTRDRYARTRSSLQRSASTRTRATRRRARQILVRLSGRERRFQTWLNHNISKFIILSALTNNCLVAIEDLTGIRERTNTQPRTALERRRSNSWSFFQLRTFLEYKGLQFGVEVVAISPRYTSRTCHKCLHIHPDPDKSYRSGKRFKCGHCGWKGDADANGSQVIKLVGIVGAAHVNPLGGSILSCNLLDHIRATEKPPLYRECG